MGKLSKGMCAAFVLSMGSNIAVADHTSISYDYVQASAGTHEITSNGTSADGEAVALRGSMRINRNVFISGGLESTSADSASVDLEALRFDLNVGYRARIGNDANNPIDMYATLGVESYSLENAVTTNDFEGFRASLGARIKLLGHLEGIAELQYRNLDTDNFGSFDGFGYMVGIIYTLTRHLDLGLYYEFSDIDNGSGTDLETESLMLKARYRFK